MEIVKFENKKSAIKESSIADSLEEMKKSTNFILISSDDNCNSSSFVIFNTTQIDSIGLLEVTKHYLLHNTLPDDGPVGHEDDLAAEGGN